MKRIVVLVLVLCVGTAGSFAAGSQEGKPVTVTLMHFRSELTAEYNALFAEFTKANPNIKVEAQMLGAWESAFKTRRAANELADVIMIHSGAEIVETANGGYLEDLSSQPFMKNVPRGVLNTVAVDQKDYMLPIVAHNAVPFYNVDLFAKYKVKPPTNWDELMAACETFKANGVTPPRHLGARGRLQHHVRSVGHVRGGHRQRLFANGRTHLQRIEHVLQRTGFPQSRRPDTDLQEEGLHSGWGGGHEHRPGLESFWHRQGSDVLWRGLVLLIAHKREPGLEHPADAHARERQGDSDHYRLRTRGPDNQHQGKGKGGGGQAACMDGYPEGRGRSPAVLRRGKHSYPWRLRFHPRHAGDKEHPRAGQVRRPDGERSLRPAALHADCLRS